MNYLIFALQCLQINSLECFKYTCESSEDGSCVERPDKNIDSLNLNYRCGNLCDRETVENYFRDNPSETSYDGCDLSPQDSRYNITLNEKVKCPSRDNSTVDYNLTLTTYTDFYQKISATNCTYNENNDLILIDEYLVRSPKDKETYLEEDAHCGLNGITYCRPSTSSHVFDEFWDICEDNNDKIDLKTKKLWEYYQTWFVEVLTAPYCAEDVFFNISIPNLDFIVDLFAMHITGGVFILFF